MLLKNNEIHIWWLDFTNFKDIDNRLKSTLSMDELKRAERFKFHQDTTRFIYARGALRYLLSAYLQREPDTIEFSYNQYGKPSLIINQQILINFNLSHSHQMIMYAFNRIHPLGVDIEFIQANSNHLNIAKRYFSQTEYNLLLATPPAQRTDNFYHLWARKEAALKADGKGLYQSLNSFSLSEIFKPENLTLNNANWLIQSLKFHPQYAAAIAHRPSQIITQMKILADSQNLLNNLF
jgi:4'-phosphopantetheinyl transferase